MRGIAWIVLGLLLCGMGPIERRGILTSPPGMLDALAASPSECYSVRRLRRAYQGPLLQIRRSSDNTTLNIGQTRAGDLDTEALLAFVGSGNGFVSAWYDQCNNHANMTQGNATLQPQLVSSGALLAKKGRPAPTFSSSVEQYLSSTIAVNSDASVAVFSWSGGALFTSFPNVLSTESGNYSVAHGSPGTTNLVTVFNGTGNAGTFVNGVATQTMDMSGSLVQFANPGISTTTAGSVNEIGKGNSLVAWAGVIAEVVIFPSVISSNDQQNARLSEKAYFNTP